MEKGRLTTVLAGLGAGITEAITVVTPAETIKTKLVHDLVSKGGKYNGLIHGTRVIVGEQGFMGIYRGKHSHIHRIQFNDVRTRTNYCQIGIQSGHQILRLRRMQKDFRSNHARRTISLHLRRYRRCCFSLW